MVRRSNPARSPHDDSNSQSLRRLILDTSLELLRMEAYFDEKEVAAFANISFESYRAVFRTREELEYAVLEEALEQLYNALDSAVDFRLEHGFSVTEIDPSESADAWSAENLVRGIRYLNRERGLSVACCDLLFNRISVAPGSLAPDRALGVVMLLWLDVPASKIEPKVEQLPFTRWVDLLYTNYRAAVYATVPLRIYFSTDTGETRAREAAKLLASALDAELDDTRRPELASWFADWFLKKRHPTNSTLVEELTDKVQRALELKGLHQQQANVDEATARAVKVLSEAIESQSEAAVQVGSILIVKFQDDSGNPCMIVRTLSPMQVAKLERSPRALKDPKTVLEKLAPSARPVRKVTAIGRATPIAIEASPTDGGEDPPRSEKGTR
jgi:hypothetical protein